MKMHIVNFGKRGQLKIQQMAFMLIAVVLFFALVAVFLLAIKFSSLKETAEIFGEEDAMLLVAKIANSPEFECGRAFGATRTNCVDADKLMVLLDEAGDYRDFWGIDSLGVRKVADGAKNECNSDNYPECNSIELIEGRGVGVGNFVSLCHKESSEIGTYDKCELAKIIVSYDLK